MRFSFLLSASLVLSTVLSGCASLFPPSTTTPSLSPHDQRFLHARQQDLAAINAWNFSGRLSIKTNNEAWTGLLRWQQSGEQFRINFNSPMGQGAVQLASNEQFGVEMRAAESGVFYADDAETLLYDHTGWRLPVSNLRLWIIGLATDKGVSAIRFDEQGRIQSLQQWDWHIEYKDYTPVANYDMPRKVVLQNEQLNIRIVIDRWDVMT